MTVIAALFVSTKCAISARIYYHKFVRDPFDVRDDRLAHDGYPEKKNRAQNRITCAARCNIVQQIATARRERISEINIRST
jgi:hypothetical protein